MRRRSPAPLSERRFHRWLARTLRGGPGSLLPLGDDAAALRVPPGAVAVLSTDSLVEGTHFLPGSPPELVGRAAVAVNLSDLAAKGAAPAGVLLALLLPPETPVDWARRLIRGAAAEAKRAGTTIVGGDTKPSSRRAIVGTVVGWADPRHLVPRRAARPGDRIVVTGTVGRGGAAYDRLQRRRGVPRPSDLARLLSVEPRLAEGRWLATRAHAMMDTSDGLAESAHLLAEASGVALELDAARIPWDPGLGRPRPTDPAWLATACFGGDYELFAAVPPRAGRIPGRIATEIGRVRAGRGVTIRIGGVPRRLGRGGWQPFAAAGLSAGPRQRARVARP